MLQPAVGAALDQGCIGQGDDPRRPEAAEAGNDPEACGLQQQIGPDQEPGDRRFGWDEEKQRREPGGVQQHQERIAVRAVLDSTLGHEASGIPARVNQLRQALRRHQQHDDLRQT
jgi:hypothetical protein